MGKKLDALFGKNFNSSKFNPLVNLAISRLAVLRNQRQARCSIARSDIVQLLDLGHHDRALLRVEQVIKEQNMLDVFVMIEGYCHLLAERINLIEQERVCPEELKEAVAGLLYASTRCGEFPELQEMRAMLTSQFGKEFAARAIELRNNCGVNPKIIQKLSTRQPSLENRVKVLKEIASENNIVLHIEEASSMTAEEIFEAEQKRNQAKLELSRISGGYKAGDNFHNMHGEMENMESFSDSMKAPRIYKDVADAAQAAFKSAAYAAAAARAAVELSKSESPGPDDQDCHGPGKRKGDEYDAVKTKLKTTEDDNLRRIEDQNVGMEFEKVHPIQKFHSDESEDKEIHGEKRAEESEQSKTSMLGLNSDLDEDVSKGTGMPLNEPSETMPMDKGANFDESDDETGNEQDGARLSKSHDLGLDMKPSHLKNEDLDSKNSNRIVADDLSERDGAKLDQSQKKIPLRSHAGLKARLKAWIS